MSYNGMFGIKQESMGKSDKPVNSDNPDIISRNKKLIVNSYQKPQFELHGPNISHIILFISDSEKNESKNYDIDSYQFAARFSGLNHDKSDLLKFEEDNNISPKPDSSGNPDDSTDDFPILQRPRNKVDIVANIIAHANQFKGVSDDTPITDTEEITIYQGSNKYTIKHGVEFVYKTISEGGNYPPIGQHPILVRFYQYGQKVSEIPYSEYQKLIQQNIQNETLIIPELTNIITDY